MQTPKFKLTAQHLEDLKACSGGKIWFNQQYKETEITQAFLEHLGSYCLETGNDRHAFLTGLDWLGWLGEQLATELCLLPSEEEAKLFDKYLEPWLNDKAHANDHLSEVKASMHLYCQALASLIERTI